MASFTISADSRGIKAKLIVTEASQSIDNNQTVLSWYVYMWNPTSSWYSYSSKNAFSVTINGTTVYSTSSYGTVSLQNGTSESSAKLMASGSTTVGHDADGTKTVALSFRIAQEHQSPPLYLWTSSTNATLTTIARASQPSCITYPNTTTNIGKMGDTIYIHMNQASDSFTHTVGYSWSNLSGTIATNVKYNCQWTIPKTFANNIPSAKSGTGTITVTTYSGSTYIGSKSVNFTVSISDDMKPSISSFTLTPVNSNSVIANWNVLVKNLSKMTLKWSASGSYSSSISHFVIKLNGVTSTVSSGYTTGLLGFYGNKSIEYYAVDSRGVASSTSTYQFTVYDYSVPNISTFTASRVESDQQSVTSYGVYSISSVGGKNSISSAILAYRKSGASTWTSYDGTISSGASTTVTGFSEESSYEVRLSITDTVGNVTERTVYVGTAAVLLDFRAGGKGFSIGKISEKDAFEIDMTSHFYQPIWTNKGLMVSSNAGVVASNGWVCLAQIVTKAYCDYPIEFTIGRRLDKGYSRLTLTFKNSSDSDPEISSFTYIGGQISATVVKTATSTWKLYVEKSEAYDNIFLADIKNNWDYGGAHTITYPQGEFSTSKPTGGTDATPIIKYNGTLSFCNGTITYTNSGGGNFAGWISASSGATTQAVMGSSGDYVFLSCRQGSDYKNYLRLYPDGTRSTTPLSAPSLELSNTTPFIDFHYNSSASDYTARIIENTQGALTAYNSISSASDERLKKDFSDIPDSYMNFIEKISTHCYRFKNGSDYLNAGLVAQEVIALEKECGITESVLVRGSGKETEVNGKKVIDYYSIDYNALTVLLLKYIVSKLKSKE